MGLFHYFDGLIPAASLATTTTCSADMSRTTTQKEAEHNFKFSSLSTTTQLHIQSHRPAHKISPYSYPAQMPLELIMTILEHLYYDENHQVNTRALRSCSLVCRDWRFPSQRLLFSHVNLRDEGAYESFSRAVDRSTLAGRALGDAVMRLRVVLDSRQPSSISQRNFANAFSLCPNLFELDLALFSCYSSDAMHTSALDDTTLQVLSSGPRITSLRFTNWSKDCHAIHQFLRIWPNLKSLSLCGQPPTAPSDSFDLGTITTTTSTTTTPPGLLSLPSLLENSAHASSAVQIESSPSASASFTSSFPGSLHEVRLNFQVEPSLSFLKWLLHNSLCTLRVLGFERDPSAEVLNYFVDAHGAALLSLSLPGRGIMSGHAPAGTATPAATTHAGDHAASTTTTTAAALTAHLKKCVSLREVRFENPDIPPAAFRGLSDAGDLQHLAFGVRKDTNLQPVLDAIKAHHKLRVVTVQLWEDGVQHPQLSTLKVACAFRGFALRFTTDVRVFRNMARGDPIEQETIPFPRVKFLANEHAIRI